MRLLTIALTSTALSGCSAIAGVGNEESRNFAVSGFDAVRVSGSDNVKIVRGSTPGVTARGPAKILDHLDIRTEGTQLIITRKPSTGMSWSDGDDVVITVTMPTIRTAEVAGSSDVEIDRADGSQFEAAISGSGSLRLASVEAASTKLRLSGSGSIDARGKTGALSVEVSGSGDLSAKELRADTATISVRGSGNVDAYARTSAALSVSGSGDITVAGTRQCAITKRGSGEARCTG
jgi:Putative auto-transporter adhesin, head GIN domain